MEISVSKTVETDVIPVLEKLHKVSVWDSLIDIYNLYHIGVSNCKFVVNYDVELFVVFIIWN